MAALPDLVDQVVVSGLACISCQRHVPVHVHPAEDRRGRVVVELHQRPLAAVDICRRRQPVELSKKCGLLRAGERRGSIGGAEEGGAQPGALVCVEAVEALQGLEHGHPRLRLGS
eukprot:scaffold17457_cov105-Isochrysis_galbana.AAC.10